IRKALLKVHRAEDETVLGHRALDTSFPAHGTLRAKRRIGLGEWRVEGFGERWLAKRRAETRAGAECGGKLLAEREPIRSEIAVRTAVVEPRTGGGAGGCPAIDQLDIAGRVSPTRVGRRLVLSLDDAS